MATRLTRGHLFQGKWKVIEILHTYYCIIILALSLKVPKWLKALDISLRPARCRLMPPVQVTARISGLWCCVVLGRHRGTSRSDNRSGRHQS